MIPMPGRGNSFKSIFCDEPLLTEKENFYFVENAQIHVDQRVTWEMMNRRILSTSDTGDFTV